MPSFADQIISFLLNLQKIGHFLLVVSFTELDDGKIYRKPLYLMVKTMVSCRFSLKPIHWIMLNHHSWFIPYFCWLNLHGWLKTTVLLVKPAIFRNLSEVPMPLVSSRGSFVSSSKFQVTPTGDRLMGIQWEYDWENTSIWDDSDHIVPSYHHDVLFNYVYL